jgi:5-methylcytosine-specific restriction endonuclease McrA
VSEVKWRWGEFKRHLDGTHLHQCGAKVARDGRHWISTYADGVTEQRHSSLNAATKHLYSNDPNCWWQSPGFGSFMAFGRRLNPSGGLMVETGEHADAKAFTARTCERFRVEPYAIRLFQRKAFGQASCAKCGLAMAVFRLRKLSYVADRVSDYPFNPASDFRAWFASQSLDDEAAEDPSLAWAFVACECGHPVWHHPQASELSHALDRARIANTRNNRIRDAEGYYTDDDIRQIFESQAGRCAYCGDAFSEVLKPTVDHVVALASGGSHWPSNLCLACQPCNSRKGTMPHADFVKLCQG